VNNQVQKAIKTIEENNWVETLRQCPSLKERLDKLMELLPRIRWWSPPPARQLIFLSSSETRSWFWSLPFLRYGGGQTILHCGRWKGWMSLCYSRGLLCPSR